MKNRKIYWIVTCLIGGFMLFSAWFSGTHEREFTQVLGFPNYFRIELTAAKIIGAVLLFIPAVPVRIREWIYVSFGIVLISAAIAKGCSGYPLSGVLEPLSVLVIMTGAILWLRKLGYHRLPDDGAVASAGE